MNEIEFLDKHEPDWLRLNQLCAKADVAPKNLSGPEIREIFQLYRRAARDLSLSRSKSQNLELINFLNDLVSRSYAILYRRRRIRFGAAFQHAIATSAQTVRRQFLFVLLSFSLFAGSGLFAFIALGVKPELRQVLVMEGMSSSFDQWKTGIEESKTFEEGSQGTAFYMSNNPLVSVRAAGLAAATFGIGTVYIMVNNGMLIGTLTRELVPVDRVGYLYTRILPHGVPELSGIILAGAAGFVMGYALLFPGRRSRWAALSGVGKDAATLIMTAVVLMYIAAPIEGYFSFNGAVPPAAKMAFSAVSAIAWGAFWYGYGRNSEPARLRTLGDDGQRD